MNSTAAANLKTKWTDIVNCFVVQGEAVQELTHEKLSFLEVQRISELYIDVFAQYELVLGKICEITAARSFAKPLPAGTSRITLVKGAKNTFDQLEGTVPAALALMMSEILKEEE